MYNKPPSVFDRIDLTGYDNLKTKGAVAVSMDEADTTNDSIVIARTTYHPVTGEKQADRVIPLKVSDLKAERDLIQKKIDGWDEQVKALDALIADVKIMVKG